MPTIKLLEKIENTLKERKNILKEKELKLNENIVMSIDLSLKSPGVTLIHFTKSQILLNDKFTVSPSRYSKEKIWNRLAELKIYFNELIDYYQPRYVIIENVFMSPKTARSNKSLYTARGVIIDFLKEKGLIVKGVNPSEARAFLKIEPNTKEQAFIWVKEKFPELNLTTFELDNDKADSVIVGLNAKNPKTENI